jgi:cytochrome c-type biogenesis protein CcmE
VSRIDDDLEQAVAVTEAKDAARAPVVEGSDEPAADPRRRLAIVLGLVVIVGALALLILSSTKQAAIYSKGVDELVAEQKQLVGRNVRADGQLVHGTLKRRQEPCEYRFSLEKNHATIEVRYPQCVVPDTFRDLPGNPVLVTVEGQLTDGGFFLAERILPKCPSRYDMDRQAAGGTKGPHPVGSRPSR